jgi:YcxB-like protein
MEFEYEVSVDDYADALILYYRLNRGRLAGTGKYFIFAGLFLAVGLAEKERGMSPLLLIAFAALTIWLGIVSFFPRLSSPRACRLHYRELGIEGKKYRANINSEGLSVSGDGTTWSRQWTDISSKGETKELFMLYSRGTLFIFAKRYLNGEQQQALRSLMSLPAH